MPITVNMNSCISCIIFSPMNTKTLLNSNKSDVFRFNHCMIISQSNRVRKIFCDKNAK